MELSDKLKQAAALFHAALERPPEQRAAFLAEARGTDPDSFRLDVADYARALKPIPL